MFDEVYDISEVNPKTTWARDTQKSRVYKWEDLHIKCQDKSFVPFDNIQSIINHVWSSEGYIAPPTLLPNPKNSTTFMARANRLNLWASTDGLPTWVILHELSHSMTLEFDDMKASYYSKEFEDSAHGPNFVGIYMKLLEKYINIRLPYLFYTASLHKVKYNINARAVFAD